MATLDHSVLKQTLSVACDSTDCALALRERLSDLNTTRLIPIIERVLSETAEQGRQIRIDRLEVNLGDIAFSEVETVMPPRLYERLKEAIESAITSPFTSSGQSEIASQIELLEWYLRRGTLPWWAPSPASFSLSSWFLELAEEAPAALAGLIRQIGGDHSVLKRIVQQLDVRGLERLVAVLDAEHADLILAYIFDLGELHRDEPLVAVETTAFHRLTWLLVLAYLVREAGSRFNRKMFIGSLLRGFALHEGIGYDEILMLLGSSLERTLARRGFLSSLPSVIAELVEDTGTIGNSPEAIASFETDDKNLDSSDPARLAQLVRRFGSDWNWLERLVDSVAEETLIALIRLLEPEQAMTVVAFLLDVRDTHREEPVVADPRRFHSFLWVLALSHLVRDTGSEFNRKAFLLSLIERLVRASDLTLVSVLASLKLGLKKAAARAPLRSSLPAILASLIEDLGRSPVPIRPGDPPPSAELPVPSLDAPMAHEDRMAQLRVVRAALGQTPVSAVREILMRTAPLLDTPGTLMADAYNSAVENVADPRTFYASLIVAAANGENLDFERAREESTELEPLPEDFRQWDFSALKAAIVAHLSPELPVRREGLTLPTLLAALFRSDTQGARQFLKSLAGNRGAFQMLARSFAPEELHELLGRIDDPNSGSLRAFLGACNQLSAADRPSGGILQSLVLTEIAMRDPMHEMDRESLIRILRAAFPTPLPNRIRESLLASIGAETPILREALSADGVAGTRANSPTSTPEPLAKELEELLEARSDADYRAIRDLLADPQRRRQLKKTLRRPQLARLAHLLAPGQSHILLQAAGIFVLAWARTLPAMLLSEIEEALWTLLFELLAEGSASVTALTAKALERFRQITPPSSRALAEFHRRSEQLASEARIAPLRDALEAMPIISGRQLPPRRRQAVVHPPGEETELETLLYVANAGLVLASPFLPHFFSQLDMLQSTEKHRSEWRDDHAASRAVHLLQYLVDESVSKPEPMLALNKIICGLPAGTPVEREIELTRAEKELSEKLLQAMIANWIIISNTSVAGLRETFLQREGKLERSGEAWKLRVQRKTLDVLVDQVPWSFSTIFHDWMPAPVHVTW